MCVSNKKLDHDPPTISACSGRDPFSFIHSCLALRILVEQIKVAVLPSSISRYSGETTSLRKEIGELSE